MGIINLIYPFGIILIIVLIAILLRLCVREKRKGKSIQAYIKGLNNCEKVKQINEILEPYGFFYNTKWDCFSSRIDAWQKDFGYCRFYDIVSPYFNMIIDCEPIYFEYDKKLWLIELWKGQYGMTIGAEVGIYNLDEMSEEYRYISDRTIFNSVEEKYYLPIGMTIWKKDEIILEQKQKHWWLANFALGEFANPQDLHGEIEIVFQNQEMCMAFLKGIQQVGYDGKQIYIKGYTVFITFDIPYTKQPKEQKKLLVKWKQKSNYRYCKIYKRITRNYDNTVDKVFYLMLEYPLLFELAMKIGKTRELFKTSE